MVDRTIAECRDRNRIIEKWAHTASQMEKALEDIKNGKSIRQSRPSMEQVMAIVNFMEKHPALAQGQLRGLEGRDQSKKLWLQLTKIVNSTKGPTRPMKSWIKYWADKKSTVRSKVLSSDGDGNSLSSNIEKKIWDLFLANDTPKTRRSSVKQETINFEESYVNDEDSLNQNDEESEPVLLFDEPVLDTEQREMAIMDKLVKVMSTQASALSQIAQASHASSQAMERLAEASHMQARAIDRLASTFESISSTTQDVKNAIVDIDSTMKQFYATPPT